VRMKIRMPDALAARARLCAADVGDSLGEWIAGAVRWAGPRVADWRAAGLATRADSECLTLRLPPGLTQAEIRRCVEVCCDWCEARRVPMTQQPVGRYLVGVWN